MVTERQTRPRASGQAKSVSSGRKPKATKALQNIRIQHVSLGSLVRVSFIFYIGLTVAGLVATTTLWLFLTSLGIITKANHLIDQLVGTTNYNLTLKQVLIIQVGLGVAFAVLATAVTFLGGVLYNIASDLGNGISIAIGDDSKANR